MHIIIMASLECVRSHSTHTTSWPRRCPVDTRSRTLCCVHSTSSHQSCRACIYKISTKHNYIVTSQRCRWCWCCFALAVTLAVPSAYSSYTLRTRKEYDLPWTEHIHRNCLLLRRRRRQLRQWRPRTKPSMFRYIWLFWKHLFYLFISIFLFSFVSASMFMIIFRMRSVPLSHELHCTIFLPIFSIQSSLNALNASSIES